MPRWIMRLLISATCLAGSIKPMLGDTVVVFNEIMYHPATQEAQLEWLELHNQLAVKVDISEWSIQGGIDYAFPEGTIIPAEGYLVVAISPLALALQTGFSSALGPF